MMIMQNCTDHNLIDIVLFILYHKCWRSVGHQVLQPAKHIELALLGQWTVVLEYFTALLD